MTIDSSTFISDVVLFIRNKLRENLDDPLVGRTNGFVMTSFPKRQVKYPVVVVRHTGFETRKLGMQSETKWGNLILEITSYCLDSKQSDRVTQEIIDILRKHQYGIKSTDVEEIHGFEVTSVVPVTDVQGNLTIHQKVIQVEYKVILS